MQAPTDWFACMQGTPPDGDSCWSNLFVNHVPLDINGDGLTDVIEFMSLSTDDSDLRNGGVWGPISDVGGGWGHTYQPVVKINQGGVMNAFLTVPYESITLSQPYIFKRVEPAASSPLPHLQRSSFAMHLFKLEVENWWNPDLNPEFGLDVPGDPGLRTADFNEDGRDDLISFSPLVAEENYATGTPVFWINAMMMLSTGTDFADPVPIPTSSHPTPTAQEGPSRDRPLPTDPLAMNASVQPWGLASPLWAPLRVWYRGNQLTGSPDTSLERGSYNMTKVLDADGDGQPDFISPVSEQNGRPVFHVFRHEGNRPDDADLGHERVSAPKMT